MSDKEMVVDKSTFDGEGVEVVERLSPTTSVPYCSRASEVEAYMTEALRGELEGEREAARDGNADYLELQSERDQLRAEVERLQRETKNDAIAYKAAIERQDELRAQLAQQQGVPEEKE